MNGNPSAQCEGRRSAAIGTAAVSSALALVVCVLLGLNYSGLQTVTPLDSPAMRQMKDALREKPGDAELQTKLRMLDLDMRREISRRQRFSARGGLLLAGFVVIFLVSASAAVVMGRQPPIPGPAADPVLSRLRAQTASRKAIALLAGATGFGAILWTLASMPVLDKSLPTAVSPPHGRPDNAAKAAEDCPSAEEIARNWASFRGPGGAGISAFDNVPKSWNGATGEAIRWKTPIPLPGENSPVVWGNRVFLTGATRDAREVYCFDADTGALRWQRKVGDAPEANVQPPKVIDDTGFAAPTCATDGRRVYAIFANGDVAAFDFSGNKVWSLSLGNPRNEYGYASSLTMYHRLLLILFDQGAPEEGLSTVIAVDGATGKRVWEKPRPVANSWATPIVIEPPAGAQFVTCAEPWVIAYDPADGNELWRARCLGKDVAPSPLYAGGLVFACTPNDKMYAINPDGRGDVTQTHIVWETDKGVPDITSPVSNGEIILLLTTGGLATCLDVNNGEQLWQHEFKGNFRASPSCVGDSFYLLTEAGDTYIIGATRQFQLRGTCALGEKSNCSPAFADGRIYIRGRQHLFCIGGAAKSAAGAR